MKSRQRTAYLLFVMKPRHIEAILAAALVTKLPATLWFTCMLDDCWAVDEPGTGTIISGQDTLGTWIEISIRKIVIRFVKCFPQTVVKSGNVKCLKMVSLLGKL